jgi:2'-5' RNA ligase
MEKVASQISVPRFKITLSELGYWPRPKVAWLAPVAMPENLQRLATSLNANLQVCGYEADKRPFQAHITLLRKARSYPKDRQTRDIVWPVDRFALVESQTQAEGVEYSVLAEWPLR